jgi:hypothetical protein
MFPSHTKPGVDVALLGVRWCTAPLIVLAQHVLNSMNSLFQLQAAVVELDGPAQLGLKPRRTCRPPRAGIHPLAGPPLRGSWAG